MDTNIIRYLEPGLINQIAAGEVVERPASVIKELLENALDAQATQITLTIRQGGQSFIGIEDNGIGMSKEDLILSVQRHTTSKLPSSNLWDIRHFGFRGEALAAISSIARVQIETGREGDSAGWCLIVDAESKAPPYPISFFQGTRIQVKDLFYATPARLKFLRSPTVESQHILDVTEKISLMHPQVRITIKGDRREKIYTSGSQENRITSVIGEDFLKNSFFFSEEKDGYKIEGYIGIPTFNRSTSDKQFFYVNHRPVKDKILQYCLRTAFSDTVPKDRFPVAVLFITVPPEDLDVNVHPAKTEVRFRDISHLRQFSLHALKQAIFLHSHKVISLSPKILKPIKTYPTSEIIYPTRSFQQEYHTLSDAPPTSFSLHETESPILSMPHIEKPFAEKSYPEKPQASHPFSFIRPQEKFSFIPKEHTVDFGNALGQIQNTYIIAQSSMGLILIDPHAAHERILLEKLKKEWGKDMGGIQPFLLSLSFPLTEGEHTVLHLHGESLKKYGFSYTISSDDICSLHSIPEIFKMHDPLFLFRHVISVLLEEEEMITPQNFIELLRNQLFGEWGCKKSIWLGKKLSLEEINALLRLMEKTPNIAQCNHGRPVYCTLSLEEMGRLFHRR